MQRACACFTERPNKLDKRCGEPNPKLVEGQPSATFGGRASGRFPDSLGAMENDPHLRNQSSIINIQEIKDFSESGSRIGAMVFLLA